MIANKSLVPVAFLAILVALVGIYACGYWQPVKQIEFSYHSKPAINREYRYQWQVNLYGPAAQMDGWLTQRRVSAHLLDPRDDVEWRQNER